MRGRIYDPKIGRFLTPDPFINGIDAAGLNRYSYVRNDPLNFVDPSGFELQGTTGAGTGPTSDPNAQQADQQYVIYQVYGETYAYGPPGSPPPPPGAGPGHYDAVGSDLGGGVIQQWVNDESLHQMQSAEAERASAGAATVPSGGPPTGASSGSQEQAASTTEQPTDMQSGPGDIDRWPGGDSGTPSDATPDPRISQSPKAFAQRRPESGDATVSDEERVKQALFGASLGANAAGTATGVAELWDAAPGFWRGINGQWYPLRWGGNQYTGSRTTALAAARRTEALWRGAGRAFFVGGVMVSFAQGYDAWSSGDTAGAEKAGLDIGMGTAATFGGPMGLAIGTGYYVLDFAVGWEGLSPLSADGALVPTGGGGLSGR